MDDSVKTLEDALQMSGCKTSADLVDMALVGLSLMERIHSLAQQAGPFQNWTPADDPAEIVFDLVNHYEDALTAAAGPPQPQGLIAQPLDLAPRDGTMVFVLVDYTGDGAHPLEDAEIAWTIGSNNEDLVGDAEGGWTFAGWCWQQDIYTQGAGKALGWAPMPSLDLGQ